jgi:hypothetical protein
MLQVKNGLHLVARHKHQRQEVFAVTSYTVAEMQYILDVHLGKFAQRKRKEGLDHLTELRPSEEMFPNSFQLKGKYD